MKNVTKMFFSVMLALMLVIATLPLGAITAFAGTSVKTEKALFNAVSEIAEGGDDEDNVIKLTKDINISQCLRIPAGNPVIIDLNGHIINRGLSDCQDIGSVIRVEPGAVLTIKDSSNNNSGVITGGASWNGGGICNHGTLTLESGTISGNKALHNTYGGGGGIYNGSYNGSRATLTLTGGVISNNEARNGGGVYNSDGAVIIKSGSYSATVLSELKTYETNVTIKSNTASVDGSGIYTERDISIQDAPNISGNKNNEDIYLLYGRVLKLTGKLRKAAVIGIKTEDYDNIITSGYFKYQTEDPNEFFKTASSNAIIRMSGTKENGGEVKVKVGGKTLLEIYKSSNRSQRKASELFIRQEFDTPTEAFANLIVKYMTAAVIGYRVELTLGSDYTFDGVISVPEKAYLVVDLNGHYIKRNRNNKKIDNGGVFIVNEGGTLTINDSNPKSNGYNGLKGGVITGGANSNGGGGITVENNANLFMNGGTIYQCSTDYHGGGICAKEGSKQIVLKKCQINSCKADDSWDDCNGGGVYAKSASRLELENVTVKSCYSEDYGGGVYYYGGNNGIFIVSACTFDNNKCGDDGGAAYYSSSEGGYFDKCTFTSNRADDDGGCVYAVKNGLYVYEGKKNEPVMIRESTMKDNSCGDEGSAVFVDRNDVVFVTDTITGNTADDKGAVYVSHNAGRYGYDISVKGLMVIKDNTSQAANRTNIVLENYGATHNYIYCAGLYEGSYVSFSVLDSGKVKTIRNVGSSQIRYFHPEKGSLSFETEKTVDATLVTASVFSGGSYIVIIAIAAVFAVGAAAAIVYKKKKGGNNNDGNEK